jgi:hypothetical protein
MEDLSNMVAVALTRAMKKDISVQGLIDFRVPVTSDFTSLPEPWIVGGRDGVLTLGPLGLINGVLIMAGADRIAAHYDDKGRLTGFWPCDANGKPIERQEIP